MLTPVPLTTLCIGALTLEVSGTELVHEVRIVRDAAGGFRYLSGGTLSEPQLSLEQAVRSVAASATTPDLTCSLTWREGLATSADERACPICAMPVAFAPRYPRKICPACVVEAADARGRLLRFGNLDLSGGFEARYRDDESQYASHDCFVRGLGCYADEARFGGIVVQLTTK